MPRYCLGLGSNLGNSPAILSGAVDALAGIGKRLALSGLYRTRPMDLLDQPDFFNAALILESPLDPRALLAATMGIEAAAGRERIVPKGPRTLDIDILAWDGPSLDSSDLQLPHPRLCQRRFALQPLLEIWPDWCNPASGQSGLNLLPALAEQGIYAVHPLLYNDLDIWKSPYWNPAPSPPAPLPPVPSITGSALKISKAPSTSCSS